MRPVYVPGSVSPHVTVPPSSTFPTCTFASRLLLAPTLPPLPVMSASNGLSLTLLAILFRQGGFYMGGRAWTDEDLAFLRQHYPLENPRALARHLERSPEAELTAIRKHGLCDSERN